MNENPGKFVKHNHHLNHLECPPNTRVEIGFKKNRIGEPKPWEKL
jgi:hypothetical protein